MSNVQTHPEDFSQRVNFGNYDANLQFLDEAGVLSEGQRILEIGTGRGALVKHLRSAGYDVVGVEINLAYVRDGEALYGKLPITLIDSVVLPFISDVFDVVISFDVFEHIHNSDHHLEEVRRVLKPHGVYALQTPNKWTNMVFETIRWQGLGWREDHCALHTREQLTARLDKHGFDVAYFDIPVVNAYFKKKVSHYIPVVGPALLRVINPDKLPPSLRTNIYAKATLRR